MLSNDTLTESQPQPQWLLSSVSSDRPYGKGKRLGNHLERIGEILENKRLKEEKGPNKKKIAENTKKFGSLYI